MWTDCLADENIFFVTPDVKRGIGLEDVLPKFYIICSYFDPLIPILRKQGGKVFCLEEEIGKPALEINNSGKLLEYKNVLNFIKTVSKDIPRILFFKPSIKLELLIEKNGYTSIGNSSRLNEQFENKINSYKVIQRHFAKYAIPSQVGILENLNFVSLSKKFCLPLTVQFSHGWAGKTTFFIETERDFSDLSARFRKTRVKVSSKISGITVLNNCCIYDGLVMVGPAAIQLSNISQLHPNPSVTCGRQWPAKFITKEQEEEIHYISKKIGSMMGKNGFYGFFGLDFLIDRKSGRIYFSEINARLTASSAFYTKLERNLDNTPLLVYHIAEFLKKKLSVKYNTLEGIIGSQVIFRLSRHKNFISGFPDFGVFSWKDNNRLLKKEYFPEKLKTDKFIFLKRAKKASGKDEEELARIEAKSEVLENPDKLKQWLRDILAGES